MAPIDIVQAEAEVATREESVILAEAAIDRAQDSLRTLVFNPQAPDFWTARIEPTEPVNVRSPRTVDIDGAVKSALAQRTDIPVAQEAAREQRRQHPLLQEPVAARPQRVAQLQRAGDRRRRRCSAVHRAALSRARSSARSRRATGSTLGTTFAGDFPAWTFSLAAGLPDRARRTPRPQLARARAAERRRPGSSWAASSSRSSSQVREFARQVHDQLETRRRHPLVARRWRNAGSKRKKRNTRPA